MISEATLNDMATSFNLGLSPTVLAKEISTEPAFQSLGKFDRNQMNLVLRNAGTTEDRYVLTREALETRRQLAAALTGKSTIPTAALKAFNGFTFEKRDVNYIALKEEAIGDIEEPSDDALNKYFEEKKITFRAPEYRSFEILKLEPGDIIDTESVTDEEAKIFYETAASRFVQPEKRQMQQILFNSEEEAKAAADKIAAGASYEDIMAERNLAEADVDFGLLTKEEITDPAAAEEIYSLEEGQISGVIKGRFGSLLLRTAKIVPSQASPFEELKEQLKAEIAAQRATGEVLDVFDKVEDERAGGSTLKEIANKLNLPLRTVNSISKVGELQNGDKVTDLPEQEQLLSSVFESDIDFEADPVEIDNSGFAWFIVTDIVNSRDRTIDEVKDDVIAAWKKDELTKRNAALSAEILKEVKGGKSLEAVATERGLTMETATDVTRQAGGALPASAVQQAFNGPLAYKASAVDGDTQYILEVAKVTEPEFDADALQLNALRQNLDTNVGTDMLSQLSSTVLSDIGYTINEALMQQIVNGTN
jgi:peptidyl-prolyl cis-trans isomerase D